MQTITVATKDKQEVVDITDFIMDVLPAKDGVVTVFVQHTTAALTTADLDPGTDKDLMEFLSALVPNIQWRHMHDPGHAPDHLLASLVGQSVSIPCFEGKLQLGLWQRIVLLEFNGPKEREVSVAI